VGIASAVLPATVLIGGVGLATLQDDMAPNQGQRWAVAAPPSMALAFDEPVYGVSFSPAGDRLVAAGSV
jgi:hypothetical protein